MPSLLIALRRAALLLVQGAGFAFVPVPYAVPR